MKQNKDIADELKQLESLKLSQQIHDVLVTLFHQCYLVGRLRGIEYSQKQLNDFIHHVVDK